MSNKRLSLSLPTNHSRLGVASLIVAILVLMIVYGDVAVILFFRDKPSMLQGFATMDSVLTCFIALLTLVGLGLGLAAVIRKEAKRVFGILGLVLNGLFLLVICVLYVINVFALMRAGGV